MFCSHLTQAGAPDMRDNAIINSPEIVSKCVTERAGESALSKSLSSDWSDGNLSQ